MPTREEMRSLSEEIVYSYEDRVAGVAGIRAATKTQLKEFDGVQAVMSRELKADLAKIRSALEKEDRKRQSETKEFMSELGKAVAQGKAAVKTQLKEFDDAQAAMSRELKADLVKVRPALEKEDRKRQSEAREFMGQLGRTVAEGKAATKDLLRGFAEGQAGARDEWQKMTATMQSKRGGVAVAVKPAAKKRAEVTLATAQLRDQVFQHLANHPDGTKIIELEQEFRVARIQMARLLKNLMDDNKVAKRELLYFAI